MSIIDTHKVIRSAKSGNCKVVTIDWEPIPGNPVRVLIQGSKATCDSYITTKCPKSGGAYHC